MHRKQKLNIVGITLYWIAYYINLCALFDK